MSDQQKIDEMQITDENLDESLADLEAILAEEDPDFLKSISEIKIDNEAVSMSLMDQAIEVGYGRGQIKKSISPQFLTLLGSMFSIRSNSKMVILFWLSISVVGIVVYGVFKTKIWNQEKPLFLTSFAEFSSDVLSFNPLSESEFFFDNPRLSKNVMTLSRMVANLKPSEASPSPMLAFELNIEGISGEVVVEIKDREAEFKDIILRSVEEFTYDELVEIAGKQKLAERLLSLINANLTRGQVRRVLYKSFVIKP